MAKKVAEAERFSKKGSEYCQIKRRPSQFFKEEKSFWWSLRGLGRMERFLRARSQMSAPRRISALVAPQTRPTAIIFSTSPVISLCSAIAYWRSGSGKKTPLVNMKGFTGCYRKYSL
ncbi:hypothetical protein OWV82_018425, partial [Melia azedarach]